MATIADLIRRALVLATVIADDETPTAQQQADALSDLNDLCAAWNARGLVLGGPYLATQTPTWPDDHARGMRFILAVEIAPSYGVSAASVTIGRRSLADIAETEMSFLRLHTIVVPDASFDPDLAFFPPSGAYTMWRG